MRRKANYILQNQRRLLDILEMYLHSHVRRNLFAIITALLVLIAESGTVISRVIEVPYPQVF
jgi:hypothetical protein